MMCKLKGGCKGAIMICKLKRQMDKEHYDVQSMRWIQKVAL